MQRGRDIIVPRGDVVLLPGDNLVLGAGVYEDDVRIQLKEIILQTHHPWVGHPLRDLDISRQTDSSDLPLLRCDAFCMLCE